MGNKISLFYVCATDGEGKKKKSYAFSKDGLFPGTLMLTNLLLLLIIFYIVKLI